MTLQMKSLGSGLNLLYCRHSSKCFNIFKIFSFRLRFAANQWQQLVTNAETLMNELVANGLLQGEAQNKVNSWLCLKEEYANCIDPDLIAMKPRPAIPKESNLKESDSQIFCSNGESKTLHVIGK